MSKSTRELLKDFTQKVGKNNSCFFKLKNGQGCYGEIEELHEDFFQFLFLGPWSDADDTCEWERIYHDKSFEHDEHNFSFKVPLHEIDLTNLFYWDDKTCIWMHTRWQPEDDIWIDTESKPGDIPRPEWLTEDTLEDTEKLKSVGFWQSEEEPYLPHPKYFVDQQWRKSERDRIVTYLKAGYRGGGWLGYSYCRFGCFYEENLKHYSELIGSEHASKLVSNELLWTSREMGSCNQTDGLWIWPVGLAHYVENHHVCLPEEFVSTMEQNSWSVPTRPTDDPAAFATLETLGAEIYRFSGWQDRPFYRVDLSSTQITDAGLVHLTGLTSLEALYLRGCRQITDAGLVHLKGQSSLSRLDLSSTQITGEGLEHLKDLSSLSGLDLSSTQITDAGLEHLKGMTELSLLDLKNTKVTKEGMERLQAALPNCSVDY